MVGVRRLMPYVATVVAVTSGCAPRDAVSLPDSDPPTTQALLEGAGALVDRMVTWQPPKLGPVDSSNPYFMRVVDAGERAIPFLLSVLKREDSTARLWAIRALGAIGDPNAFEPLLHEYRSRPNRWTAISVCACLNTATVPDLFSAFGHREQELRDLLREAYGSLWPQVQQASEEELRADLLGRLDEIRRQCRAWAIPAVG